MPQAAGVRMERRALSARAGLAAASAVVGAVALAIYWPALHAGLVGDDFMILHRLRQVSGAADVLRFFRGEFFEYYRPLGFVSHAVNWLAAGYDARAYHFTNLLLHTINSVLVLAVGWTMAGYGMRGTRWGAQGAAIDPFGPLLGALLFALHPSNHEAVVWISARFDLLAATFALAAVLFMIRGAHPALAAAAFGLALLSKESVVAVPVAAAGWAVFVRRDSGAAALRYLTPWLIVLALYAVARQLGGGVSAIGGAGRLPKLVMMGLTLAGLVAIAGRGDAAAAWARRHARAIVWTAAGALIATAGAGAALPGSLGDAVRAKLAVAGFVTFNLASPVIVHTRTPFYLDPTDHWFWLGGLAGLAAAVGVVALLWRHLVDDGRMLFIGSLLAATLIPISALTEGTRYLYLPAAALFLGVGLLLSKVVRGARVAAASVVVAVLAISGWQISGTLRDWTWAGRMTADAAALVDGSLAPGCGEGHVVFLTSPVAVRGVYTHFYYETFEPPRGCIPALFQVVARVVRQDARAEARWEGPRRIVVRTAPYEGNYLLAADLRHFDRPVAAGTAMTVSTPLGEVRVEPHDRAQALTLTLSPSLEPDRIRFFYYSDGAIHSLARPAR